MNRKVKVGKTYIYDPVFFDQIISPPVGNPEQGYFVVVVNLNGCPPANTMGSCYINFADSGEFAGMVSTNSLKSVKEFLAIDDA